MTDGSPGGLRGRRVVIANWRDPWHHLAGGSERYAWELATALSGAGAAVEFWTARDAVGGVRQPRRDHRDGIDIVRGGSTFTFYPVAFLRLLGRRLRRRPALVVDMDCGIPLFARLAVGRGTPVLLVVHHVHLDQFATYFGRPLATLGRLLEGRLMPAVYRRGRTIAVSPSTMEEMRERLRWDAPVTLVPNGTDRVPEPATDDSVPDRLVVLGRLATHKRVDVVLEAVARLVERRPQLRVDVIGRGPAHDGLLALRHRLGLEDRVTLHGFLPEAEKSELFRRARLHVCLSDAEGWGQVVVEAAAHGVPTLARDVPGLRDSVRNGETGWLVARDTPRERLPDVVADAVVAALDELDDEASRHRYATACRAWAARFTWSAMHADVVRLAEEEVSPPPSRRLGTSAARDRGP